MLWLGMLFCGLAYIPKKIPEYIMCFTVIGNTMFNMLFEAQARYNFIMAPLFIIITVLSLKEISLNGNTRHVALESNVGKKSPK